MKRHLICAENSDWCICGWERLWKRKDTTYFAEVTCKKCLAIRYAELYAEIEGIDERNRDFCTHVLCLIDLPVETLRKWVSELSGKLAGNYAG